MSNQLEKLKSSIQKKYVKDFELNLMKTSGFIPIDKRQNNFYVVLNKDSAQNKDKVITILKEKYGECTPQFVPLGTPEFNEVLDSVTSEDQKENTNSNIEINREEVSKEPTAEEMLVSIGWITKEQLNECKNLAAEQKKTLDIIFHEKGYLSNERIASYLQKKFGVKVVTKPILLLISQF